MGGNCDPAMGIYLTLLRNAGRRFVGDVVDKGRTRWLSGRSREGGGDSNGLAGGLVCGIEAGQISSLDDGSAAGATALAARCSRTSHLLG